MSKFEIKLTDDELDRIYKLINSKIFPMTINKRRIAYFVFDVGSEWNIRKVREAVSRLQELGKPIIAHHGGYSVFGDDPQPVIEYLNREYHRVHEAQKKNDQVYAAFKRRYGSELGEKVKVNPDQPELVEAFASALSPLGEHFSNTSKSIIDTQKAIDAQLDRMNGEPAYQKTYDCEGTLYNV
jgi:hypothetical protein